MLHSEINRCFFLTSTQNTLCGGKVLLFSFFDSLVVYKVTTVV